MSSPVRTLDRTAQASAEILFLERTGREGSRWTNGRGVQSLFKQQSDYDSQREVVRSVVEKIGLRAVGVGLPTSVPACGNKM